MAKPKLGKKGGEWGICFWAILPLCEQFSQQLISVWGMVLFLSKTYLGQADLDDFSANHVIDFAETLIFLSWVLSF